MPIDEMEEGPSNDRHSSDSSREQEECVASEEYSVLPEVFYSLPVDSVAKEVGAIFHQKKYTIFRRVEKSVEECNKRFRNRKELASETDQSVIELCASLEELFYYGLKQPQLQQPLNFVVSAASLFQNMQEIVTGTLSKSSNTLKASTESSFWEFCQNYLTPHERERFANLKQVWTNLGKGRSFIRAALNEHSLQRYILMWLSEYQILSSYYCHWSVLLDESMSKSLPDLIKSLDQVLFALNVDTTELNVAIKNVSNQQAVREEPLIYAPSPVRVEAKVNRKSAVVERPIVSTTSTDDLLESLKSNTKSQANKPPFDEILDIEEQASFDETPTDPIEPELAFLKEPLACSAEEENNDLIQGDGSVSSANSTHDNDVDTSSQSSKLSYNQLLLNCNNSQHLQLEEQLKDTNERCSLLETRVAQLTLENRQLIRRLKKHFEDSGIDPSSSFAANFLITIPHTKLHKANHATGSFHLYEIHITMRQNLEHWSIWRRYSDFNKLHKSLLKTHPIVSSVEFPPKKRFGNMNIKFVEERRQQLQIYLLSLVETLPQLEACKSKAELQKVFPFLRER